MRKTISTSTVPSILRSNAGGNCLMAFKIPVFTPRTLWAATNMTAPCKTVPPAILSGGTIQIIEGPGLSQSTGFKASSIHSGSAKQSRLRPTKTPNLSRYSRTALPRISRFPQGLRSVRASSSSEGNSTRSRSKGPIIRVVDRSASRARHAIGETQPHAFPARILTGCRLICECSLSADDPNGRTHQDSTWPLK